MSKDCTKCTDVASDVFCNLCYKRQITKLDKQVEDLFKEYQDIAGIHSTMCTVNDKRIADLEGVLRATRVRLLKKSMTTLMIDEVLK